MSPSRSGVWTSAISGLDELRAHCPPSHHHTQMDAANPSRREASSRVVCSSVYREVGWWEVRQLWTGARRKCFQNTSIHSMNLRIKVQQRREEQQTSIGDCWLTQLQRNQHFVYGTRTMHTVISSVKPGSVLRRGYGFTFAVGFFQLLFSKVVFLYPVSIRWRTVFSELREILWDLEKVPWQFLPPSLMLKAA